MSAERSDRQIVAALADRSARGTPRGADDVIDAALRHHVAPVIEVTGRERRSPTPPRWPLVLVAAALVIGAMVVVRLRPGDGPVSTGPAATTAPVAPGPWRPLDSLRAPGRDPRYLSPSVWTGTEVITVGGLTRTDAGRLVAESPAVDVATGRVRLTREPPDLFDPTATLTAAWTGTEIVVSGRRSPSVGDRRQPPTRAAAYDPGLDTWRVLPDLPDVHLSGGLVWTGDRLLSWPSAGTDVATYEPAGNRWVETGPKPPDGIGGIVGGPVVWTGARLVRIAENVTQSYDPATGRWSGHEAVVGFTPTSVHWTGAGIVAHHSPSGRVVLVDRDLRIATDLPPAPERGPKYVDAFLVGPRLVLRGGFDVNAGAGPATSAPARTIVKIQVLDLETRSWSTIASEPGPAAVFATASTGDRLVSWTVLDGDSGGPTLTPLSWAPPPR